MQDSAFRHWFSHQQNLDAHTGLVTLAKLAVVMRSHLMPVAALVHIKWNRPVSRKYRMSSSESGTNVPRNERQTVSRRHDDAGFLRSLVALGGAAPQPSQGQAEAIR